MKTTASTTASNRKSQIELRNFQRLWRCPDCGERFTGKNMAHSCGKFSLDDLFARREPQVRKIFQKFERMVRACGPVHVIPQKTRVVFQVRMRFAGATPRKSYLICHFILPRRVESDRFRKIETYTARCHGHYLAVRSESELDAAVVKWLRAAYRVGEQKYVRRAS